MSVTELIGIIVGIFVVLIGAIKWILSDWQKKSEEIEKLKSEKTRSALYRLEEDISDFKIAVESVRFSLNQMQTSLVKNQANIGSLKDRLQQTDKLIETYAKTLNLNLKDLIKTELVELSQRASLIRNKKNGES